MAGRFASIYCHEGSLPNAITSPYIIPALLGFIEEGVVEMLPSLRKLILEE